MYISTVVFRDILLNNIVSIGNINELFVQLHFSSLNQELLLSLAFSANP